MDDLLLNDGPATGGQKVRAIEKGTTKTQVVALDLGGAGAEDLASGRLPTVARALEVAGTLSGGTPTLELDVAGMASCAIDLRGTWTGTVSFQATIDGATWFNANVASGGSALNFTIIATTTVNGAWVMPCSGYKAVRVNFTTPTSGTPTAVLRASQSSHVVFNIPATGAIIGALSTSANAIGDVGVQYRASATGAATPAAVMSPATPAAASLKGAAGRVLGLYLQNSAAAIRSLKLFNATAVTLGTTAAAFEIDIPAGGAVNLSFEGGLAFGTGIQWAVTGAKGLTDNTGSLAANDVSGFIAWA